MINRRVSAWIAAALVSATIGIPLLRHGIGEYYHLPFIVWGSSFIILNLYIAGPRFVRVLSSRDRTDCFRQLLAYMGAAWVMSIIAFFIANLTPLCVGQDNGDGIDTVQHCVFYTVVWGGINTAKAAIVIFVTSLFVSWFIKGQRSLE